MIIEVSENNVSEEEDFETIEIDIAGGIKEFEIYAKGNWNHFKFGDEIRYESPSSNYHSKIFRVRGFNMLYGGMFAYNIVDEEEYVHITDPVGIILLERNGHDFSVSKAIVIGISGKVTDRVGRVVAINPERPTCHEYLVRFKYDFEDGHDCKFEWEKPWYPRQCKVEGVKNLYLCLDEQIKFLR